MVEYKSLTQKGYYFGQRQKKVAFTRSRPYHKNDNGHVEQKNWTHVRRLLGYDRLQDPALREPINALERDEDPFGVWRTFANSALAGGYVGLFARIDLLAVMTAPDFATVRAWRGEQERRLRERLRSEGRDPALAMDDAALDRFVAHYQRLTEWIAQDLPDRADIAIRLNADRQPIQTRGL